MAKNKIIQVKETSVNVLMEDAGDFISLTDMLKAKDGDFFISDWLRNRNTVEFLGIWESVNNPNFNYGEFAIIRSQAGLNYYKLSVKESINAMLIYNGLSQSQRLSQLNQMAITQMKSLLDNASIKKLKN
jgi:hypothetical protein